MSCYFLVRQSTSQEIFKVLSILNTLFVLFHGPFTSHKFQEKFCCDTRSAAGLYFSILLLSFVFNITKDHKPISCL